MTFPNSNVSGAGISKAMRPDSLPAYFNSKRSNNNVASLKNIAQAKVQFSQSGRATATSGSSRLSTRTQNAEVGTKVKNARGCSHKNEANNESSGASPFNRHETSVFNDTLTSVVSGQTFSNERENEAIDFLRNEISDKDFEKIQTILADPRNNREAVDKAKKIFVMLKMLSEHSAKPASSNAENIKKDIDFYVDNIKEYGLGVTSPFAGSFLSGASVLEKFDDRVNKNSDEFFKKNLGYNPQIEHVVELKINMIKDNALKAKFLSGWKDFAFRPSISIFNNMEQTINGSRGYQRASALLNHQTKKLDLFKEFLLSANAEKVNDVKNTDSPNPNNGMSEEKPGPTFVYYDFSTTTDNSIHFADKYDFPIIAVDNPDKGQEGPSPATEKTSDTQREKVTIVPEKQSDRSTDGQRTSDGQKKPETTTGAPTSTARTDKPIDETLTPPVAVGGHTKFDDIDEPALPREAPSTPDTHVAQLVRTSVQRAQRQVVGDPGPLMTAQHTSFIGPFSTGRTGAAQYKQYWQPASTTSNNGQLDKKNEPSITPSSDAGTGIKRDSARTPDPHVKAEENPVSYSGVKQKQRGQVATMLTKAKSNAAIVQSVETQSEEGSSPSLDVFIGPNRTGRTGAAEFKRYWKSAKKTVADTDTQAGRQKPLPGDDEKTFLTRSNVAERAKIIEFAGSETDGKTPNGFDTRSPKTTTSPEQIMPQQQSLNSATGTNKQKSDIFMGPHRTGRTGAANFKKYASDSNTPTVTHAPNRPGTTKPDAEPLAKAVSSSTIEKRVVNKTDATIPANRGVEHTSNVAQHKARVEAEATKVQIADDALRADTVSEFTPSSESSLANLHQGAPAGGKKALTDAGNNTFKGPHWTGMQGAAAKQYYMNADRFTKK